MMATTGDPIAVSFGKSQRSHKVRRVLFDSLSDLREYLIQHPSTADGGPYLTAAPMRGNVRSKANAEPARLIGLDIDDLHPGEVDSLKLAAERFSGLMYQTRSSTVAHPRYRLLIETERAVAAAAYKSAYDALVTELSLYAKTTLKADPSCNKSEQPLFTPLASRGIELLSGDRFVPPDEAESVTVNGIDTDPLIDESQRNVSLASIAGTLRARGASVHQIYVALVAINATLSEPLPDREVRTISKSYGRYDQGERLPEIRIVQKGDGSKGKPKALPAMPDGLTAQIVAWAADRAQDVCPQLDLAVGLMCTALLTSNRYLVEAWNTPLQPYVMVLAPTGGGKSETRKSVAAFVKSAARAGAPDLTERVFSGFQSYHALFDQLAQPPAIAAWLWDEAARRLKSANRNSASPDYQVLSHILDLYGCANSTMPAMPGRGTNIPAIDYPFLTVLAMAQPSQLTDAVTQTDFDTGLIARFLLLDAGEGFVKRNDQRRDRMGPSLMRGLKRFIGLEFDEIFEKVRFGTGMHKRFLEFDDYRRQQSTLGPTESMLWTRANQNALLTAGLIAVGRDPKAPVIDSAVAEYAIALSTRSIGDWILRLSSAAAGSTWNEKLTRKVEELIRDCVKFAARGRHNRPKEKELMLAGVMPLAVLKNAIRYDKRRDIEDILTALREAQMVDKVTVKGVTCYRWKK
jgi:hypothetical protein